MTEQSSVQINRKTSALLQKLAVRNKRTKAAHVEWLVETDFMQTFHIDAADVLPGPDSSEPVIVVSPTDLDASRRAAIADGIDQADTINSLRNS